MSNPRKSFWQLLLDFIASFFRRDETPTPAPPQPSIPPDNPDEPANVTISKILVIVYDPVMDQATGQKLSEQLGWGRVEDLATGFMSDILQNSYNMVHYQVIERIDVNEFPAKVDGFRYTPQTYMDVLRGVSSPYMPQEANYYTIIEQFNLLNRIARDEIDEVWIFGFPHAGFYESIMAGPGAFWCNAPALRNTDNSGRRFVIMGFSYERGVGEMLESFGHRVESILEKTFEHLQRGRKPLAALHPLREGCSRQSGSRQHPFFSQLRTRLRLEQPIHCQKRVLRLAAEFPQLQRRHPQRDIQRVGPRRDSRPSPMVAQTHPTRGRAAKWHS